MKTFALMLTMLCVAACVSSRGTATSPDPLETDAQQAADLALGKQAYEVHCMRCHGPDGKDETYPFIARLDGIGARMTPEEIREATWASGFVSPRSMNADEREALGRYVATL